MWVGKGAFDPFGYFKKSAYIKGIFSQKGNSKTCYLIVDNDIPGAADQFSLVPVDEQGQHSGETLYRTAGQVLYATWEEGSRSPSYDISNRYIEN